MLFTQTKPWLFELIIVYRLVAKFALDLPLPRHRTTYVEFSPVLVIEGSAAIAHVPAHP
jgi:hypothetical protein